MAPLRVYLAAPYATRETVGGFARELPDIDMVCESSWLDEGHEINQGTVGAATALEDAVVSGHALDDLNDVDAADVLVLFTAAFFTYSGPSSGRHVETGYALAKGKHVIVVGKPENVFHRIQSGAVEVVDSWYAAKLALQQFQIRRLREALEAAR